MLEKIVLRFLHYVSKTVVILSSILLVISALTVIVFANEGRFWDINKLWTDSIGSYWFLRILVITIVFSFILLSVEPYYELEKKRLEDEAKKNNTGK